LGLIRKLLKEQKDPLAKPLPDIGAPAPEARGLRPEALSGPSALDGPRFVI
jgi:hypothetical protein